MHPSADTRSRPMAVSSELASLYATYALILFAVPTFGVAAAIGLLRLWTKALPTDPVACSHFRFQRRTLIAAVASVVLGGLLIMVGVGVFVLFAMAVWTLVRGTLGLQSLLLGQAIRQPDRLFY